MEKLLKLIKKDFSQKTNTQVSLMPQSKLPIFDQKKKTLETSN